MENVVVVGGGGLEVAASFEILLRHMLANAEETYAQHRKIIPPFGTTHRT
jgi:hypothetical protein